MQEEEDFDNEEFYFDEDAEYERGRDLEADELMEGIDNLYQRFVVKGEGIGYYKNSLHKFADHIKSHLDFMVKQDERKRTE